MRITARPNILGTVCEEMGLSRDELARQMGVSSPTAYRVDKGLTEPSPKFIAALINVTGKSFEDLFEIQGEGAA